MFKIKWSDVRKIATNEWVDRAEAEVRIRFLQGCLIGGALAIAVHQIAKVV
ncbi:hypothetical protein D3C76_363240 [compost metagenome]